MTLLLLLAACQPGGDTADSDQVVPRDGVRIALQVPPGLSGNERVGAFQMALGDNGLPYVVDQVAQVRLGSGEGTMWLHPVDDAAITPLPGGAYGAMYLFAAWDDVDNDRFEGPYEPVLTTSSTVVAYPTDATVSTVLPFTADEWQAFTTDSAANGRLVPIDAPVILDQIRPAALSIGGTTPADLASVPNARISTLSSVEDTAPILPNRPVDQSASPFWTILLSARPASDRLQLVADLPGVAIDAEIPVIYQDRDQNGLDLNDPILGGACVGTTPVWLLWLDPPRSAGLAAIYTLTGLRGGWQTVTLPTTGAIPTPLVAPGDVTFGDCPWH